jgi:hypothetical protein
MIMTHLEGIANAVVGRARQQGYVVPREVRAELQDAGLSDELWKDVISLAGPALGFRQGRYYYLSASSQRREEEEGRQRSIQQTIRRLFRRYRAEAARTERRGHGRFDFIQPVKVLTEDGREHNLLSRDLSPTGLRLIAGRSLLGQKVRVSIPGGAGSEPSSFLVQILWTCAVGDDLFENGGTFLDTF